MSDFSTSLDPSEADVEAAVAFKGPEAKAARYRGQSDTSTPQLSDNEDFLNIQVRERVRVRACVHLSHATSSCMTLPARLP